VKVHPIKFFRSNRANKIFSLFLLGLLVSTCIDPFNPNIKGKESLLVVDGLITNENRTYTVRLSRTVQTQNEDPVMVSGAWVTISDGTGNTYPLMESGAGIYKTDSLSFLGEEGNTYTLHISTPDGGQYSSDPAIMYPVSKIDSIYFAKDQEITNNSTEILDGIRIFLDTGNQGGGEYFRWTFDEWWKFSVPNPKRYNYIDQFTIPEVDTLKQVCYSHSTSDDILIHSSESSQSGSIKRQPVLFVGSDQSDRLLIQYCIDIKQLSLSPVEYQFWEQLKEINDGGGDIFDKQPFSIIGNVHNLQSPSEPVLGYFQVSAVQEKRIYVIPDDLASMNLPVYKYDCERVVVGPADYPPSQDPSQNVTFDKIYASYTSTGFTFIEPVYDMRLNLQQLVFTKPVCAICTSRGELAKPPFWTDIVPPETKK
jgi:hypothetical protein